MTRRERAMDNFRKGYNCSQAVVLAYEDILPIQRELLLKAASSFGGGMGRLRELLGIKKHRDDPTPEARTKEYYEKRPCPEIIGDAAEILGQYMAENPAVR